MVVGKILSMVFNWFTIMFCLTLVKTKILTLISDLSAIFVKFSSFNIEKYLYILSFYHK